MKKSILVLLIIMTFAAMLAACNGNSAKKALVGQWTTEDSQDVVMEFLSDGTVIRPGGQEGDNSGKWVILDDGSLKVTTDQGETMVVAFEEINGEWIISRGDYKLYKLKK